MGLFSKILGTKRSDDSIEHSFILDIAELITDNDSAVISKLQECTADPWGYAERNADRYSEKHIDVECKDETDIDDICWTAMVNELNDYGYLFSADYSENSDNVLKGLSELKNYDLIEKYLNVFDTQCNDDVEEFVHKINHTVKDTHVCMIDIESDNYELIIVNNDVYKKISATAKKYGYSIISL